MAKGLDYYFQQLDIFAYSVPLYYFSNDTKKKSYCGATVTILIFLFSLFMTVELYE